MCSLIFLFFAIMFSCSEKQKKNEITILWENKKATGISISGTQIQRINPDSIASIIKVTLFNDKNPVAILGEFEIKTEEIVFKPLIPFTRGLHYDISIHKQPIGSFKVPNANVADAPALQDIFPTQDTLPENLLKIYLRFSQSMREGQSDKYVTMLKNNSDTVHGAFLNLQPELWNEDRTLLTLWLDPGRIKRDLQPNKLLGAPLQKNGRYQIVISRKWKDEQGLNLIKNYSKRFVTTVRDGLSPNPKNWKLRMPQSNTLQSLRINFGETLDYSLLLETLKISTEKGENIAGKWIIGAEEQSCEFAPSTNWKSGIYKLKIETRLEDLAGNNLNRPFDRDVTIPETVPKTGDFFEIPFKIER